jgi:hypothetical protein
VEFSAHVVEHSVSATDLMQNRAVAGLHLGLVMEQQPDRIQAAMKHLFQLYEEGRSNHRSTVYGHLIRFISTYMCCKPE